MSDSDSSDSESSGSQSIHARTGAHLADLKHEGYNLQLEVVRLQHRVDLLEKDRQDLISQLREARLQRSDTRGERQSIPETTQQSRINFFPIEVYRLIFMQCLPENGNAKMAIDEAPLVLGQVCGSWRSIVWSTPELWNTLHITFPDMDYDPLRFEEFRWESYFAAARSWLDRSGQLPLSLSLVDENVLTWYPTDPREQLIAQLIQLVATEANRWKHVQLNIPGLVLKEHLKVAPSDLPMLETFQCREPHGDLTAADIVETDAFDDYTGTGFHPIITCPTILSLHLGDVSLLGEIDSPSWELRRVDRLWSKLNNLSIGEEYSSWQDCLSPVDAYTVFQHLKASGCPLQRCRIVVKIFSEEVAMYPPLALEPVVFPLLQTFELVFRPQSESPDEDVGIAGLLTGLQFPSLHSFEYKASKGSMLPFVHLLSQSPQLEKLCLYVEGEADPSQVPYFLERFCANVTELRLSVELSSCLTTHRNPVLGRLKTLKLDCSPPLSRERIYKKYGGSDLTKPTWDKALRKIVERQRYADLDGRISFIERLFGHAKNKHICLKEVDFRLNERLRGKALRRLAPLVTDGVSFTFRNDYYDLPPPVAYSMQTVCTDPSEDP